MIRILLVVALFSTIIAAQDYPCTYFQIVVCDTKNSFSPVLVPHELRSDVTFHPNRSLDASITFMEHSILQSNSTVYGHPINLCMHITHYAGHGVKLQAYMDFLSSVNRERLQAATCDVLIILADGSDVIINNIHVLEVESRWKSFNNDIVLSTEMSCWIGHFCTQDDVKTYYSSPADTDSPSIFINSGGMIGRLHALWKLFCEASKALYKVNPLTDDQWALTALYVHNKNLATKHRLKIQLDHRQLLFGSFTYVHSFNESMICPPHQIRTCYDIVAKRSLVMSCCLPDFHEKAVAGMFEMDPKSCNVFRVTSSGQFYSEVHLLLVPLPVFWHGNGAGKFNFRKFRDPTLKCHASLRRGSAAPA